MQYASQLIHVPLLDKKHYCMRLSLIGPTRSDNIRSGRQVKNAFSEHMSVDHPTHF